MQTKSITNHYDHDYFSFQKDIGEFGGRANLFLFEKHVLSTDTVLDFGCGGGFLLKNLDCHKKIGVELNPVAREFCNKVNGVKCVESLEWVEDSSIDLIISSHCLEHTPNPFELVSLMYTKLKDNGRIVIVVPLDSYKYTWTANDVNNHLYSFSPMNLGNILQGVGLKDIVTMPVLHKWPPGFDKIQKIFGLKTFHVLSWLYGFINKRYVQVKAIGVKKASGN